MLERGILILASVALLWAAAGDWKTRRVPLPAGIGMLLLGLSLLFLERSWMAAGFYAAAVWCSRGGIWRLPVFVLAILLLGEGGAASLPLALGILYTLAIFSMGWFGGGDAQLALGLIGLGGDGWIVGYLFGGTILLAAVLMVAKRGLAWAGRRGWQVARHLHQPDEEAIRVPWALLAAAAGLAHIWIWPWAFWR